MDQHYIIVLLPFNYIGNYIIITLKIDQKCWRNTALHNNSLNKLTYDVKHRLQSKNEVFILT